MRTLLLLVMFAPCLCVNRTSPIRDKTVFFWDVPPYIWEDENGKMRGSVMHSIEMWEKFCNNPHSKLYKVKGGYKGFSEQMYDVIFNKHTHVHTEQGVIKTTFDDAWLPLLNITLKEEYRPTKQPYTFFASQEMVVIIPRYKIEILHKIALGVKRSVNFVMLCGLLALVAGMIIWFIERWKNKDFPQRFIPGASIGLWWTLVTLTTVGYGDVIPRSVLGRILGVMWMCIGVLLGSVMTASITDSISTTIDYEIKEGYRVAVLADSSEMKHVKTSLNARPIEYNSYELVLEAVVNGTVFAAVLNKDIASYIPEKKMKNLVIVKVVTRPVPVSGLFLAPALKYYGSQEDSRNNMTCLTNFNQNIVVDAQLDHHEPINIEIVETLSIMNLLQSKTTVKVIAIVGAAGLLLGLLYEAVDMLKSKEGILSKLNLPRGEEKFNRADSKRGEIFAYDEMMVGKDKKGHYLPQYQNGHAAF